MPADAPDFTYCRVCGEPTNERVLCDICRGDEEDYETNRYNNQYRY